MAAVDEQHLIFVDLAAFLTVRTAPLLVRHVAEHFRDEERLMTEEGVDVAHVTKHRDEHARFLEVLELARADLPMLGLALRWLPLHMVGVDQQMAQLVLKAPALPDDPTASSELVLAVLHEALTSTRRLEAQVAHELANPLAFVGANLNQLEGHVQRSQLVEAGELRELFIETHAGIERMTQLVRRLQGRDD